MTMTMSTAITQSPELVVLESRRTPPGRPFAPVQEVSLGPIVERLAAEFVTQPKKAVGIREFVGPYGVADLAVILLKQGRFQDRMRSEVPAIVNEIDAALVASLFPTSGRNLEFLCSSLRLGDDLVRKRLRKLLRMGAIDESRRGKYLRAPGLSIMGEVVTFEAKVSAWAKGIDQAQTYRLWSDQTVVVMGKLPRDETRAVGQAKALGIGLTVGSDWKSKPRKSHNSRHRMFWTSELFYSELIR